MGHGNTNGLVTLLGRAITADDRSIVFFSLPCHLHSRCYLIFCGTGRPGKYMVSETPVRHCACTLCPFYVFFGAHELKRQYTI